ncbi:hypothetical protein L6R52_16930 [Myxococcota bacterium]|nr:hypothetical protein [Myxococcota bacterium]
MPRSRNAGTVSLILTTLALAILLPITVSSLDTSTSTAAADDASHNRALDLVHELRLELASGELERISALDRFLTLEPAERDVFLAAWRELVPQPGIAREVYRTLRAARDRPVYARRPEAAVVAPTVEVFAGATRRTEMALDARPAVPALSFDQMDRLRKGSRAHAFGAAFAITGVFGLVGGGLGTGALAANDAPVWPGLVTLAIGGVFTAIGFSWLNAGDAEFREALER